MERMKQTEAAFEHKPSRAAKLLLFWLHGMTELLLYAPVWLVPAVYGSDTNIGRLLWLLQLPLLTLAGCALAYPIRRAWLRWLTAFAVGAVLIALYAPAVWWRGALLAAGGGAAVLRGMSVTSAESRSFDVPRYGIGIAAYALSGLICSHLPEWSVYMPWLTAAGVVSLAIFLFSWNRLLLQRETLSAEARSVPAAARGHNRLMVAAVIMLSLVVTAAASGAAGRMLLQILRGLLGLLAAKPGKLPAEAAPQPAPPPPQLPPQGETGWLARALDMLFYIIGIAAVLAMLLLAVRAVYRHRHEIARRLSLLFARLAALLGRTSVPAGDAGYVDEESAIWPWERAESALKRSWRRRFAGGESVRWNELRSNRERARFLYRQWLGRLRHAGYNAPRHLTPDEIHRAAAEWEQEAAANRRPLPSSGSGQTDRLIRLYYKARYSDGDIADDDIKQLQDQRSTRRP